MKIVFDVDGVLADFTLGFTKLACDMFHDIPVTRTLDNPSWQAFPGMTDQQIADTWYVVKASHTFWHELEPLVDDNVFDHIDVLQMAHDVYFCTARPGTRVKRQTEGWLELRGVYNPTVVVSSNKGEFCKSIDADFAIDDKAANASFVDWAGKGRTKSYLINRPYNQVPKEFLGSGVRRVDTIEQFLEVIQ